VKNIDMYIDFCDKKPHLHKTIEVGYVKRTLVGFSTVRFSFGINNLVCTGFLFWRK